MRGVHGIKRRRSDLSQTLTALATVMECNEEAE